MRASIRQVAEKAGVSPMTVTNVLRHRSNQVSEETRRRVLRVVEELNYIPVRSAVQNRHVATNTIGLLFLQEMQGAVGYPTFLGICDEAKARDHDLTIFLREEPNWVKTGTDTRFLDRRCDAFIFVGDDRPELSKALVEHKIPVVECYSVAPPEGVARILADNTGTRRAVESLVAQGHRRIAHLAGPEGNRESQVRCDAFCQALHDLTGQNSADYVVQGSSWGDLWGFNYGDDPGYFTRPLAEAVLALDVTAVVCANDLLALAVWKRAEQKGLRIPEDLSITGMDNLPEAAHRGLTSIAQPFRQIGHGAVEAALALLQGADSQEVSRVYPVELVERDSVAPPSPHRRRSFS